MAFLDDLATYLQTSGLGTVGTDIFKGRIPADDPADPIPDAIIALIETGGTAPEHTADTSESPTDQPSVQVISRHTTYADARTAAQNAYETLDGIGSQTATGGARYLWVRPLQPPFSLGEDDSGRALIVFNCLAAMERV